MQSTRPVSKTRGRVFMVSLGLLGVAGALAFLWVGYKAPERLPARSYYDLKAKFDYADNLTSSYQVRIGGRLVGQVQRPRVERGKAVVDLQLDPKIKPLLSDTRLRVRPRSPVGVRFVDLTPGTKGRPLPDGGTIEAGRTTTAEQLDEVLGTLDAKRRRKAQTLLRELGGGLAGRGEDLNATLGAAPAMLRETAGTMGAIADRTGAAERFVHSSQGAAAAADPVREDIGQGFDPGARALRPFADHAAQLQASLEAAPSTLRAVRAGMADTRPFLAETTTFARTATPALRAARPALVQTAALLRDARPGLRDAKRTLGLTRRSISPTLALLRTVDPVLPPLRATLGDSLPLLRQLGPRECDLNRFFRNWASMLSYGDGKTNVLRLNVLGSPESVGGQAEPTANTFSSAYSAPCAVDHQRTP